MVFFTLLFGTRPEYLKLLPLIRIFQREGFFPFQVIWVQQHTSIDVDPVICPVVLPIQTRSENRLEDIGAQILESLPSFLKKTTHLIVQGDTATVFYSSLVAFQQGIKVIHVEAGLRTYTLERPFPEEAYRQMVSRIASYHFSPHKDSEALLQKEHVEGKIYVVGNTILDLVKSYKLSVQKGNRVLITFHRRENWGSINDCIDQVNRLVEKYSHLQFVWFLHPNQALQTIVRDKINPRVLLENPMSHRPFADQIANCFAILTDSGGIQEEASFLGKQCIVLRTTTERSHIGAPYIQTIQKFEDIETIFPSLLDTSLPSCSVYGNGTSSEEIYSILKSQIVLVNPLLSSKA
jgi:UDP-N-acetylglucosamine 2-epimerase (non-hydrolysing)